MADSLKGIQGYFAKRVRCYEEAYSRARPSGMMNTIYHLCWFPLRLIFRHTMTHLRELGPKSVLDVGCGSGIYSVECATGGAEVTALDTCREMVAATRNLAEQSGFIDRIRPVHADFLEWAEGADGKYDLLLAIGLFDYVPKASEYLESFRRLSKEVIITFPADYFLSFLAHFSYRQQGIEGYFYTPAQIEDLLQSAGFEVLSFTKIFPSTYWVHARQASRPSPLQVG